MTGRRMTGRRMTNEDLDDELKRYVKSHKTMTKIWEFLIGDTYENTCWFEQYEPEEPNDKCIGRTAKSLRKSGWKVLSGIEDDWIYVGQNAWRHPSNKNQDVYLQKAIEKSILDIPF